MRKIFIFLLATASAFAADFERSNWHTQTFFRVEPYTPITFEGTRNYQPDPEELSIHEDVLTVPMSLGFLFSPLFTPLYKADIPFTVWLGAEFGEFQFGDIASGDSLFVEGAGYSGAGNTLSFMSFNPAALVGFSVNLVGNLDLRVLGGIGLQYYRFENTETKTTKTHSETSMSYFVEGGLEYRLVELFKDGDLKLGLHVRKSFNKLENIQAVEVFKSTGALSFPGPYSGTHFKKIETKLPVRIGLEISLEFGRESRRDRQMRFVLRDRDTQLRNNSEVKDTLSDWDCMAIERDYRFFLEDGELPDMSEKYTKAQFNDVLESYLAFCHPEDLATKEQLYSSLDSNKVQLKEYQVSQEDSRFKQVMASNDPEMLEMYLQYYPDSPHRAEIEAKLQVVGDYQVFKKAQEQNNFKAYLDYLSDFPNGQFRTEAEECIFRLVQESNRVKDYQIYLKRFPNGRFESEARHALQEIQRASGIVEVQQEQVEQQEEKPAVTKKAKSKAKSAKAKKSSKKKKSKKK